MAELGFHPTRDRSVEGQEILLEIKEAAALSGGGARVEAVLARA